MIDWLIEKVQLLEMDLKNDVTNFSIPVLTCSNATSKIMVDLQIFRNTFLLFCSKNKSLAFAS